MTITTTDTTVSYSGNGVQTNFPFSFAAREGFATDIKLYLDGVLQGSGYTVNLNADQETSPGGSVDIAVAPTGAVLIAREVPLTQEIDYDPYDPFGSETHEDGLDHRVMAEQQLNTAISDLDTDKLEWVTAPTTASDTGTAGQAAYDADYLYICVATDTWKRAALATW